MYEASPEKIAENTKTFFQKVYGWMFLGLIISGLTAYFVAGSNTLLETIFMNQGIIWLLIIGELALVIALTAFIQKISASVATLLFILYCFATGLTLSVIFIIYTLSSITQIFFVTAAMFGAMSLVGYTTKKDLTQMGQILIMGLIGIVLASIINIFFQSEPTDFIISILGVIIFTGLTAYDTQRLKDMATVEPEGSEIYAKAAIIGALTLYLDFINLFLKLLRLFGRKRN